MRTPFVKKHFWFAAMGMLGLASIDQAQAQLRIRVPAARALANGVDNLRLSRTAANFGKGLNLPRTTSNLSQGLDNFNLPRTASNLANGLRQTLLPATQMMADALRDNATLDTYGQIFTQQSGNYQAALNAAAQQNATLLAAQSRQDQLQALQQMNASNNRLAQNNAVIDAYVNNFTDRSNNYQAALNAVSQQNMALINAQMQENIARIQADAQVAAAKAASTQTVVQDTTPLQAATNVLTTVLSNRAQVRSARNQSTQRLSPLFAGTQLTTAAIDAGAGLLQPAVPTLGNLAGGLINLGGNLALGLSDSIGTLGGSLINATGNVFSGTPAMTLDLAGQALPYVAAGVAGLANTLGNIAAARAAAQSTPAP